MTQKIRNCMKDPFYPILIDEEGGKVSRLSGLFSTKEFNNNISGLPFLKTDTDNIIKYNLNNPNENKIKKRYFWNLLKDE